VGGTSVGISTSLCDRAESPQRRIIRLGTGVTIKMWSEELETAIGGGGLPWRVIKAWIEAQGSMCCAELADSRNGHECFVSLAQQRFPTSGERRAEITRQLNASTRR
jgi:hypothetical protein